ncbi:MAG: hypothetical protein HC828_22440 [Blastochloris sp.]|nr:hypothetical protein [Blastochloris sp.]
MAPSNPNSPITELRVALTTGEYERMVKFYCAGLGLEPAQIWTSDQGRARILERAGPHWSFLTKHNAPNGVASRRSACSCFRWITAKILSHFLCDL